MIDIPRVGLGTYDFGNDQEIIKSVKLAVEKYNYRHIDTASFYRSESAIGVALTDLFSRNVIKREDIWITTKLWNDHHDPEDVVPQLKESLQKLNLEYVDLYLIHWPCAFKKGTFQIDKSFKFIDTWKAMENVVKLGLSKRIGVSNCSIELLEKLRFAKDVTIQPYVNQVEYNLLMQQEAMRMYLDFRGIKLVGYSTLGQGATGEISVIDNPVLQAVAKEIGKPIGAVELKFLTQISDNTVVLAKSSKESRIKENNELDFELTPDQIERLKSQERCHRFISFSGINNFGDEW